MSNPNTEVAQLALRIRALEKAHRRWKIASLLVLIFLVAAAYLTGARSYAQFRTTESVPSSIAAHEFVLMGSDGQVRGRMRIDQGKPVLEFYNSAGELWWFAPPKIGATGVGK